MKFNIKKLILLLILLVVACVGSVVGYISYTKSKEVIKTELFPLEQEFFINIRSTDNKEKILKTNMTLEITGKKSSELITQNMSKVNDTIINTLSTKTEKELNANKREALKKDLINALNKTLDEEIVMGLFFNDFLMN